MLDLVIGMCAYDTIKTGCYKSLASLYESGAKFKTYMQMWDALIGRSRSVVATRFLEQHEADVLLFIDSDIEFNDMQVLKLLQAQKDNYNCIGGGYLRTDGKMAVKTILGQDTDTMRQGQIYEVVYVPAGFMSISRRLLQDMVTKLELPLLGKDDPEMRCYPFFESGRDIQDMVYLSEDWDFCCKVKQVGTKVYWHTGVLVTHIKEHRLIPSPSYGMDRLEVARA